MPLVLKCTDNTIHSFAEKRSVLVIENTRLKRFNVLIRLPSVIPFFFRNIYEPVLILESTVIINHIETQNFNKSSRRKIIYLSSNSSQALKMNDPSKTRRKTKFCDVCGNPARCINYGALTCQSCRAFFRRHRFQSNVRIENFIFENSIKSIIFL